MLFSVVACLYVSCTLCLKTVVQLQQRTLDVVENTAKFRGLSSGERIFEIG